MARYVVHAVRGTGLGAGMFTVHDLARGTDVGGYEYFRDTAEQRAGRLEREHVSGVAALRERETNKGTPC